MPLRRRGSLALALLGALALGGCTWAGAGGGTGEGTVTVAIVANPQMRDIQELTAEFNREHPDIKVRYVTLPENEARARITQDVATKAGQFDVVMIGTYEAPIWGRNGWLTDLNAYAAQDTEYDVDDLMPAVRKGLYGRRQALRRPVLRRVLDAHVPQGPVRAGRPDDARAGRPGPRSPTSPASSRRRTAPASACAGSRAGASSSRRSTR